MDTPDNSAMTSMEGVYKDLPDNEEEKAAKAKASPQPSSALDPMSSAFDPKPMDPMSKEFDPQPEAGEPVSKIESQNRETSWFKDVVTKFGDDLYSRFIGQEGEGTFSKALRDHAEISGTEPGVMKDRPLQMALRKTIQDVTYASARTLEGYLGLMSDAIRGSISAGAGLIGGKEFGEQVAETAMDPGVQATLEGIGPPGALAAAGLSLLDRFGTIGKVKTTGGFGDVTNLDRARDAGIIGPKAPEVHIKPDGTAMSAKEIAEAQFPQPTAAFPSNRNYDGLLSDIGGGGPVPTWGDIKGLFVKTAPEKPPTVGLKKTGEGTFDITSPTGETIGAISVRPSSKGTSLYVQDVRVNEGSNSIGLRNSRDLLRQLAKEYPNAEDISGHRISGARATAKTGAELETSTTKVKMPKEPDKVRVHTDHEATMLEADKAIEHPQAKALGREVLGDDFNKDMTGKELYDALAKELGGSEEASKALSAVGIQGIKVEGGHVVFDSRLVEPLNVAEDPIAAAARRFRELESDPANYSTSQIREKVAKEQGVPNPGAQAEGSATMTPDHTAQQVLKRISGEGLSCSTGKRPMKT